MRTKLTIPQRKAMNDAVSGILLQFVVIIISLGLANAFTLFATQETFEPAYVLSFGIYLLVGLRFLAANLLYLAYQYGREVQHPKRIYPDAIGMVVTGIVIGLQGSYVTSAHAAAPHASFRFYVCLLIILAADAVFSVWSHALNAPDGEKFLDRGFKSCDVRWVANNFVFALVIGALLWCSGLPPAWLMIAVTAIAAAALALTYDGLWKFGAPIVLGLGLWLYLAHRDATSWLMLVTIVNSVISFLLTYEGCLVADSVPHKTRAANRS